MVEDHSKGIGFERELSQDLSLDSLFHVADLQGIQDSIAMAMGVASIITRPDGSYFTEPSNLCSLCRDVIIPSDRGKLFCKAARENFFVEKLKILRFKFAHAAACGRLVPA